MNFQGNRPFLLTPIGKDYLWGGSRLNDDFGLELNCSPLAEAWMCSTHPAGNSYVGSAELKAVLEMHPEYLGTHALSLTGGKLELPILIKLIDASADLSVQVHPDDEYALQHESDLGKTEMWYVLDAQKGAELICGFRQDTTVRQVKGSINQGTITRLLNRVSVHKDDVFFIEPGTVHALTAGVLVAEVQQSSDVTYRLYDYDRVDKNGNKRPLHIEKALEVAKLTSSAAPRQPMRVLKYKAGCASELLSRCKYFQVERMLLNTEGRKLAEMQAGSNSFHVLLCVDGCGVLYGDDMMLPFFKGDCIFIPADSIELKLHGRAQLLNVSC